MPRWAPLRQGTWSGLTEAEWETEARAGRRRKYGNMTCALEEEAKSCGREVGMWSGLLRDPAAKALAAENAAYRS